MLQFGAINRTYGVHFRRLLPECRLCHLADDWIIEFHGELVWLQAQVLAWHETALEIVVELLCFLIRLLLLLI